MSMSPSTPQERPFSSRTTDAGELYPARWWRAEADRVVCELCPRACTLKDGDRGFCFVRQNVGGRMTLTTYGRSTGFCIDPIEKKPLNHFYPGTSVLSFGTAGCNLGCKFCQNWDISKSRQVARASERALPAAVAEAAKTLGCVSVAYTYNDPVVWAEYAIETAKECRAVGVKNVAVTAGYITPEARSAFYEHIDAANIDLKAFSETFYRELTFSHLEPVLDTLRWLKHETDVWFEITNLIIPGENDDPEELRRLCDWVLDNVGEDVPVHFSAFHPDFRMLDRPATSHETLVAAYDIARQTGIRYVYLGNIHDRDRHSTFCGNCGALVIERDWYVLGTYALKGNQCLDCGHVVAGRFADKPGDWGSKRMPVDMRRFAGNGNETADALRQASEVLKSESEKPGSENKGRKEPRATKEAQTMTTTAPTQVELTEADKALVLQAAAEYVQAAACKTSASPPDLAGAGIAEKPVSGSFVSLKRQGRLRSCCGSFGRSMPLQKCLQEAAHRTATSDPRFPPISPSELSYLDMEVWLLCAPEEVQERGTDRIKAVTVGRHGLQIVRGGNRGLLLPGVPVDHNWDAEEFLNQVCVKAGLPQTAWRDDSTTLYRFQGEVIRGRIADVGQPPTTRRLFADAELQSYAEYCRNNIGALIRGATPQYYCTGVSDANVNGVILAASMPNGGQDVSVWRLSLKNTMPLQSTLFSLCEDMAKALRRRGWLSGRHDVDFAIAYDPTMHGTVDVPDLEGIDSQNRGMLVIERSRSGLSFDSEGTPKAILDEAIRAAQVGDPAFAAVYSLAMQSTRQRISVSSVPRPAGGASVRKPAVAGTFYPGDVAEMNRVLDDMLAGDAETEHCHAVMVPHAGWRYSGRLAADVLKRVQFPGRVIAVGPKHTPPGVDWAVAPHQRWEFPGGGLDSDFDLARQLAESIPGLQLDAAAHEREHCLEVQLPIIARLAPDTRVVGMVVGGGSLQRCDEFAEGLASVIRQLDEKPLLLISTDMNHFADEDETRRVDAAALADLDRLDPDSLYETVKRDRISMCGVIPAVIILKTLQKLNVLHQSQEIGYSTSAEAGGDTNRVVGYAGRIFQ